jgi:hypothetical protein
MFFSNLVGEEGPRIQGFVFYRFYQRFNILLPLRGRQKKKVNRYAMFFCFKCPQGLLLIVFRPLNGKQ